MKPFRPMLAAELQEEVIKDYLKKSPLLMSPKVDGIRGTVLNGVVQSRSGKPLPNKLLQETFSGFEFLDGEFVASAPNDPLVYKKAYTGCMKVDAQSELTFWTFDHVENVSAPYVDRLSALQRTKTANICTLPQRMVKTWDEVLEVEEGLLTEGFEGGMLRLPAAPYINGRARGLELMKVKRTIDVELPILDIVEGMTNNNEAFTDELGFTKRSTDQDGMVPSGMLGYFVCPWEDTTFKVGPGKFTHAERLEILKNKDKYIGKELLKVRYMGYGTNLRPRQPRAYGFRDKKDM